jgi:hypothetical protein
MRLGLAWASDDVALFVRTQQRMPCRLLYSDREEPLSWNRGGVILEAT